MAFDVRLRDELIGTLESDRGRLRFRYAQSAIESDVHPLSVRLPKTDATYQDDYARPYFENLLPESQFRVLVAQALDLSAGNTAGLLGAIGGECIGAVSVWPAGASTPAQPEYRPVTDEWLRAVFVPDDASALATAQGEARLSLPGVEEKIALRRDASGWSLPLDGAASTHVIKRPRAGYLALAENEAFCTQLAKRAGLDAVEVSLLDLGSVRILASRRFDRVVEGGGCITRLHQEDLCQGLGVVPAQKYENEGGPSFSQAATLLREVSALPIADLAAVVRWCAFNYITGNEDAHGKNIALAYDLAGAIRLAPFYDVLCTEAYGGLKRKAAMRIGGEYRYRFVRRHHWERLAADVGLPDRAVMRQTGETAEAVLEALAEPEFSERADPHGVLRRIRDLAAHRCELLLLRE